jgi:hypothetical protein
MMKRFRAGLTLESAPEGARIVDRAGWNYPPGHIRVSDADRDRAISELSVAFQAGRITADEFDQRSGQALAARTGKELTALLADLPAEHAPATRTAPQRAHSVLATRAALTAGAAAVCLGAVAAASALSHGPGFQQREMLRHMMVRHGLPAPPGVPPDPHFIWAAAVAPGAIAVLLVALVVFLGVRLASRGDRP